MKRRILATLLAMGMCISLLVGCSGEADSENNSSTEEENAVSVAFIVGDLSGGLTTELLNVCEEAAEEKGVEFTYLECETDADKIEAMENFTNAGYDVIISSVTNADAMEPAVADAQEAGVKVMVWDVDIDIADAFIGNDDYALGQGIGTMAAEWINETFSEDETVNVAVVNFPDAEMIITREQGIRDALEEQTSNIEIVATQSSPTKPGGVEIGEVWMQSGLDINCVVAINDAGATGVYQAFVGGGVDPMDEKVGFFGCDGIEEALSLISEGGIYRGTLDLDCTNAGEEIISRAIQMANGEELEERNYYFDIKQITQDNIEQAK